MAVSTETFKNTLNLISMPVATASRDAVVHDGDCKMDVLAHGTENAVVRQARVSARSVVLVRKRQSRRHHTSVCRDYICGRSEGSLSVVECGAH